MIIKVVLFIVFVNIVGCRSECNLIANQIFNTTLFKSNSSFLNTSAVTVNKQCSMTDENIDNRDYSICKAIYIFANAWWANVSSEFSEWSGSNVAELCLIFNHTLHDDEFPPLNGTLNQLDKCIVSCSTLPTGINPLCNLLKAFQDGKNGTSTSVNISQITNDENLNVSGAEKSKSIEPKTFSNLTNSTGFDKLNNKNETQSNNNITKQNDKPEADDVAAKNDDFVDLGDNNDKGQLETGNNGVQPKSSAFEDNIDSEDSDFHFFTYFLIISILLILFYVVIYNYKKILALLIEGRRRNGPRKRSAAYSKLTSNLEEALMSGPSTNSASTLLY